MKKKLAVLVLGAFLVTGLFGCGNKVPDGTVATVNGEPISQEMLDANYTQYLQMFQMYGADITTDEVKVAAQKAALESLTAQELLRQEAEKRGLEVSEEDVDAGLQKLADDYYSGSMDDLKAAVEQSNMTTDAYRQMLKDSLLQDQLRQALVDEPETVDVVKAKHILINAETENAEQVAQDIITQLDGGADFATLAKEKSQDPGSAAEGGELGYFAVNGVTTSKMVDEFSKAAQELEAGEYSKTPVKTQFGYHIILVEDKQSDVNLLEDAEKYQSVLQGIYQYGLDNLLASLQEKAKIEILIDEEAVPEDAAGDTTADNTDAAGTDANTDASTNADADTTAQNGEEDAA